MFKKIYCIPQSAVNMEANTQNKHCSYTENNRFKMRTQHIQTVCSVYFFQ